MRRYAVVNGMLSLLLAGAVTCHASSDDSAPGGVSALADLLRAKGLITAEEYSKFRTQVKGGAASRSEIKALVDLLRMKGSLSNEEAATFLQGLTAKRTKHADTSVTGEANETASGKAAAQPEEAEAEKAKTPLVADNELKMSLQVLREQGVLGSDEAVQINQRIGRKWSAAEEDELIAGPDLDIEYSRTTLPRDMLLAKLAPLQSQGVITQDEAERIKTRFVNKLVLERIAADINEDSRRDIKSQIEERVPVLPEWTRRITLGGDIRLRYEGNYFDGSNGLLENPSSPLDLLNSTTDRQLVRVRARLNLNAKVNDSLDVGIGLATGNTTNPVSTNQTLGDSLNKKNFLLDLAYLKWTPTQSVTVWGGRFPSPWFSTDLVWDSDLNFDGFAISYKPCLTSTTNLFITAGAFPVQEVELVSRDKWLLGGQIGVRYQDDKKLTAKLAAAIYDFENTRGVVNESGTTTNNWSAPAFMQKGNTLMDINQLSSGTTPKYAYAAKFREVNLTGSLDFGFWDPVRVVLWGDYVNNIGYNQNDVLNRGGLMQDGSNGLVAPRTTKGTEGYQFGLTVGHADTREFGTWKGTLAYKYLEADAVMDAFTDSDFHLGGTNAKGWIAGLDFGVAKNTWLSTRWLSANQISGPPLAIDVFQFNLNARF